MMMVVVVQPLREGVVPLLVGAVHPSIRPLAQERLDDAFRLAIGLRAIGTGHLAGDLQRLEHSLERLGSPVRDVAVRHHPLDADPLLREEAGGMNRATVGPRRSGSTWTKASREASSTATWTISYPIG